MVPYNRKEDFLEVLSVQINNKKARNFVTEEIEQHIEDQKNAYMNEGDEDRTALTKSLEQMGDPVEVGKQLNRIHRPRMEWSLLLTVLLLCVLGISAQLSLGIMIKDVNLPNSVNVNRHILFLIIGFLLMTAVYYFDYTFFGKYPKLLCLLFWLGFIVYTPINEAFNGRIHYIYPYGLLFIVLYGGIIYAYRKEGYSGLIKCLLICVFTFLLEMKFISQGSVYLGVLLSCLLMLSAAVMKNWFAASSKKLALTMIWGLLPLAYGILHLFSISIFSDYQLMRLSSSIKSIFAIGFQSERAIRIISHAKLFGGINMLDEEYLPGFNTEYILTYVIGRWGITAGILIIIIFLAIICRMLYLSYHQKNSLGMFIGISCSLVFAVQGIIYIIANLGYQFVAQVNLPFVSYGGSSLIINFIVFGLMLSVFRNQNIVKEVPYKGKITLRIARTK